MENEKSNLREAYRRIALPIMGIFEAIASKGASPGAMAQKSMKQFDDAEAMRRDEAERARKAAYQRALLEHKQKIWEGREEGIALKKEYLRELLRRWQGKQTSNQGILKKRIKY